MKKPIEFELSRPLLVDRVAATGSHEKFAADDKEKLAVAERLGISVIHSLSAHLKALPWRGGLQVTGIGKANLNQTSVVSLEEFTTEMSFDIERYYMNPRATVPEGEEDVDIIEGGTIDLGELLVESLALALDPYPRRPGEVFEQPEDIEVVDKKSPFAALGKLRHE